MFQMRAEDGSLIAAYDGIDAALLGISLLLHDNPGWQTVIFELWDCSRVNHPRVVMAVNTQGLTDVASSMVPPDLFSGSDLLALYSSAR